MKRKKQQVQKEINWAATILKLSLKEPFRGIGSRFWDLGSNLFLGYCVIEVKDDEGTIFRAGWQLVDEMRGIARRVEKETAKRFLRGIISDLVMNKKET